MVGRDRARCHLRRPARGRRLRPPQRTRIDGLFLAGDWTDTGWPATMEGAVRSGYLASQGVLRDLDRPTRLIVPELEPEPACPLASRPTLARAPHRRQASCRSCRARPGSSQTYLIFSPERRPRL